MTEQLDELLGGPGVERRESTLVSFLCGSPDERHNADALLKLAERAQPHAYARKLSSVIFFALDPMARYMVPRLLEPLLLGGNPRLWSLLQTTDKQGIKDILLVCLFRESRYSVLDGLCRMVSELAVLILPSGEWPELLDFILYIQQNTLREHCAMVILRNLFENVPPCLIENYTVLDKIKSALLHGLDNSEEFKVRIEALKAVVNFLKCRATVGVKIQFVRFLPHMVRVLNEASDDVDIEVALKLFGQLASAVHYFIRNELVLIVNSVLQVIRNEELEIETRRLPMNVVVILTNRNPGLIVGLPKCFRDFFVSMLGMLTGYSEEDASVASHCLEKFASCSVFGSFFAPNMLMCLPPLLLSPEVHKREVAISIISMIAPFVSTAALAPPQVLNVQAQ